MNIHKNGRYVVASAADETALTAAVARASTVIFELERAERIMELRQEAADLIDTSAGIDITLPSEHRVRELIMMNSAFSDLLDRARGRPLAAPEQAQLDGLRAVFEGAKTIRAAEATARSEAVSAKTEGALRGVLGVAARLP